MSQSGMHPRVSNNDLVWNLGQFSRQQIAANFVRLFENKLCIYSDSVEQLYTNYAVKFFGSETLGMKIVPDVENHYDTFQNIPPEAIENTGLSIIPGQLVGREGLHLCIPQREGDGKKMRVVSLQAGLESINKKRMGKQPFLPVIIKGDLRALRNKVPVLHLHNIRLDQMKKLSGMERNGIRKVIQEKLQDLR